MRRDTSRLLGQTFDLLVVGAGIQGACIAWDASLRGLSVALVDRADFGAATSANSLGIAHGGLRYLARADLPRMLDSIRERSALLRIAPDLVEPLPVLLPIHGSPAKSTAFRAALALNDLVSRNRNEGLPPSRFIPPGRLVSRAECLDLFPWFPPAGLRGGALWYDGRLKHPERLTLSFVRSAAERGAAVANYLRVDKLLVHEGAAIGACVTDMERGTQFEVEARSVVVAAGPWTTGLIAGTLKRRQGGVAVGRALAVNVRISRALSSVAVGIKSLLGPAQDRVGGGRRYLFATPQQGGSLLGTWYAVQQDSAPTPEQGAASLIEEFNAACPALALSRAEVSGHQWGWLPLKGAAERGRPTALAERPRLIDHAERDGLRHLLSIEAVKYTTARREAQRAVDWVFQDLNRVSPPCRTAEVPLKQVGTDEALSASDVRRAVHEEMAVKLGDIIFRRGGAAVGGRLERSTVSEIARLAGTELGWSSTRMDSEIEEVMHGKEHPLPAEEPVG
jgi:glycerol-3-phosphate dehydrogenase